MIKIMEYRKPFQPKYEYFAHYGIRLENYDEEIADNLIKIIDDNFITARKSMDLGPNKYIDVIIHSDQPEHIFNTTIFDTLDYYDSMNAVNISINILPVPNIYVDESYYFPESDDLCSKDTVDEMWHNGFIGYGDYDDNYPTTFNAFVRQCIESGEIRLVKWIEGRD